MAVHKLHPPNSFGHLPPCVDIFYVINVDKKWVENLLLVLCTLDPNINKSFFWVVIKLLLKSQKLLLIILFNIEIPKSKSFPPAMWKFSSRLTLSICGTTPARFRSRWNNPLVASGHSYLGLLGLGQGLLHHCNVVVNKKCNILDPSREWHS